MVSPSKRFITELDERRSFCGTAKETVYWLYKQDFLQTEGKADYMWEVTERLEASGTHIRYNAEDHEGFLRQLAEVGLIKLKEA